MELPEASEPVKNGEDMHKVATEVLDGLKEFDSATLFNAVVEALGGTQGGTELNQRGGVPQNYTGPEIRCQLPNLGAAVGYAVTSEMTSNDPDVLAIPWDDYYCCLQDSTGPLVAVVKDVDTRPGRGACFGDGMATAHKYFGVTGIVVDGSVRDLAGIERVGLPVWSRGLVPGHGVFSLIRYDQPVSTGRLLIHPGELLFADSDGVTKIPNGVDPATVLAKAREVREREIRLFGIFDEPGLSWDDIVERRRSVLA